MEQQLPPIPEHPLELHPGVPGLGHRQAGPYLLGTPLASGDRSTVYRAVDSRNAEVAAVKVLAAAGGAEVDYRREVHLAERVPHPHLVRIREAGQDADRFWIAYDIASDGSLQSRIGASGHLEAEEVRRVAAEIGEALTAVHAAGLVHRDVKPSNVLVDGGRFLLGDFGSTRPQDVRAAATVAGSVPFMAPEQVHGVISHAADIYGLGATLYRAWTGANPPPLAQRRPEWPAHTASDPALRRLIEKMLDPEPSRRPELHELYSGVDRHRERRLGLLGIGVIAVVAALVLPIGWAIGVLEGEAPPPVTGTDSAAELSLEAARPDDEPTDGAPVPVLHPDGLLVMVEGDLRSDWGPNPVYYLYRGLRFHVASPEVLAGQVDFFRERPSGALGWVSWPECCRLYADIADLPMGPELVVPDVRSEGLLIRQIDDDEVWVVTGGVRIRATDDLLAKSTSPQTRSDAIPLAPSVFAMIPQPGDSPAATARDNACLVVSGEIEQLYERHRDGLGESVECERTLPDRGAYARWQNGTIWWAPGIGAHLTVFAIDAAYWVEGGALGRLGYPVEDEMDEPSGAWARMMRFEHGVIVWSPEAGTEVLSLDEYVGRGGTLPN